MQPGAALPIPLSRLAGGVSTDGDALLLRLHDKSIAPPPGAPILFVYGDLGLPPPSGALLGKLSLTTLKAQIVRATCPVVDLFWGNERVRLAASAMAWRGLPGATLSSPLNLVALLHLLADRAGGAAIDLHFTGEVTGMESMDSTGDLPAHADRQRAAAFDRHAKRVATAWAKGAFPSPAPGLLSEAGPIAASHDQAPAVPPWAAAPVDRPKAPWVRTGLSSRWTLKLWPALWIGPILAVGLGSSGLGHPLASGARGLPPSFGALALGACGLVAAVLGLRDLAFLQKLRAVPQGTVRGLAMGPVELAGRVLSSAPVLARCCMLRCAWYRWEEQEKITEVITDSKGHTTTNTRWKKVAEASFTEIPFELDDGTGKVWVQPAGAEVEVDSNTTMLESDRRVLEWMIPDGEQAFVFGVAQHRSDRPDLQARLHDRLAQLKHDPAALARYGVAAGGEVAPDQWDAVRLSVEKEVMAEMGTEEAQPDDVFVGAGRDAPFLLVERSRSQQLDKLKYRALGGTIVGSLYIVVAAGWLIGQVVH